jgi:hypothetical protein
VELGELDVLENETESCWGVGFNGAVERCSWSVLLRVSWCLGDYGGIRVEMVAASVFNSRRREGHE